jgi:hypothetical protein
MHAAQRLVCARNILHIRDFDWEHKQEAKPSATREKRAQCGAEEEGRIEVDRRKG